MAKFSVKKPFTVFVAVILVVILGVVSFTNMTPDLLPSIDIPMAISVTAYPGASPEEVELEVSKPLEQQMATLDGIKTVRSTSNSNVSMVILEFVDGVNMDTVTINMRERIEMVRGSWGDMIGNPFIMKINPDIIPVTVAAVANGEMSTIELSTFVNENLVSKLEGIEGVAAVTVSGTVEESVHVLLNPEKIESVNATVREAILEQFGEYESDIRGGLGSAYSVRNTADAGKLALTEGQRQLAEQMQAARIKLNESRDQLVLLRVSGPALILLNDTYNSAVDRMAVIKEEIRQNTGLEGDALEAECMLDSEYRTLMDRISAINAELAQYGIGLQDLASVVAMLPTLDDSIAAVDQALYDLTVQESVLQSELGNRYADAAAGSMAMQLTIAQLQASLTQLESQQQAAFNSADLTGMLTIGNISQILAAQNFSMPAGYIGSGDDQYLVSVGDKIEDVDELRDMVLMDPGLEGIDPIRLSDVADVFVLDNASEVYARIDGHDGVLLSFSKQSGYATATVSENIRARFEELTDQYEGLAFTALMDQGDYIGVVVSSVLDNLLIGALLAIAILFLFLRDIRPTFITACAIPISVTFAIVLMYFSGVTLNIISLAGLAVGVGMLVDNSIVVIENIYRLRTLGQSPIRAAISGASQVAGAITASTLTTICVFFPIVFIEGMTRQLFVDMALTIAYALLASLIVALTLVPAMASGMLKKETKDYDKSGLYARLLEKYKKAVRVALNHKVLLIVVSIVLLLASGTMAFSRGFQYMPEMSGTEIMVSLEMPEGTALEETIAQSEELVARFQQVDGVGTVGAMLMNDLTSVIGLSLDSSENTTSVTMYVLLDGVNTRRAEAALQEICNEYPDLDITVSGASTTMNMSTSSGDGAVSLRVYGEDTDDLRRAAIEISERMAGVEGIASVSSSVENSQPEIRIIVDKDKAAANSMTVAQVYLEVCEILARSQTPIELVYDGEGHDVTIKSEAVADMDIDDLREAEFTATTYSGDTVEVKLSDIATIEIGETLSSISRAEQRRYLSVSGELAAGYNVTLVSDEVKSVLGEYELPAGISLEYTGESETIFEALGDLGVMLLLGIVIVYLIMVAQFQSLLSPFIVMFTIPLAFTGGLLALLIAGMEISIVAMIGFIMLVGIVVNNGIVLIDYINTLRAEGMDKREAIIEAGATRLRPVIMTALTTILGLLPLAIGGGVGGELMQPVAVVCIGGLIYATIMTLFIVPAMYDALVKKEIRVVTEEDLQVVDL